MMGSTTVFRDSWFCTSATWAYLSLRSRVHSTRTLGHQLRQKQTAALLHPHSLFIIILASSSSSPSSQPSIDRSIDTAHTAHIFIHSFIHRIHFIMGQNHNYTGEHYEGVDKFAVFGLVLISTIIGFLVWKLLQLDSDMVEAQEKKKS
jgi:hypothetical protein